jgi:hypothetical protein
LRRRYVPYLWLDVESCGAKKDEEHRQQEMVGRMKMGDENEY